jgi:Zn-finger nucleic acid-binding protein
MESIAEGLRCLVACGQCSRQYACTGLAAGSRLRCSCGSTLEVPRFRAQDAAVVRCSSCGAPRAKGSESCAHCGADYTLQERDLHTLCPGCMTRISDRARYCHHCATPIAADGEAVAATDRRCPSCGPRRSLHSRALGDVALLECPHCAGIWLGHEVFERLAGAARDKQVPEAAASAASAPSAGGASGRNGRLYRRCPCCGKVMNRKNYGRQSGIVIDACKAHGTWFDAHELDAILRFIRSGGEERTKQRFETDRRHTERLGRIVLVREGRLGMGDASKRASEGSQLGWLHGVIEALLDPGRR